LGEQLNNLQELRNTRGIIVPFAIPARATAGQKREMTNPVTRRTQFFVLVINVWAPEHFRMMAVSGATFQGQQNLGAVAHDVTAVP
jgi:hypothetical protein